jgi:hypothetical protein
VTIINGTLPASVANLTELVVIAFDSCRLTGEVPSALWALHNLETVNFYDNALFGTLPETLSQKLIDMSVFRPFVENAHRCAPHYFLLV